MRAEQLHSIFTEQSQPLHSDQSARCFLDQSNCRDLEPYVRRDHSGTRGRASSLPVHGPALMLALMLGGQAPSPPPWKWEPQRGPAQQAAGGVEGAGRSPCCSPAVLRHNDAVCTE